MAKNKAKSVAKKWVCSLPMVRRMFTSIVLWILFGLFCAFLASIWTTDQNYWGSAIMWNIIFNRLLIGLVIAFAWFIVVHPLLKIRMYPAFRWALLWTLVSIDISFGPFIIWMENAWSIFWATIFAWAFYGLIIDLIATKVAWEWEILLEGTKK